MREKRNRLTVSGIDVCWSVLRQPQWITGEGFRGQTIEVVPDPGPGRTLIVEFPGTLNAHRTQPLPQRPRVNLKALSSAINNALYSGWSPSSRGKPTIHLVDASN